MEQHKTVVWATRLKSDHQITVFILYVEGKLPQLTNSAIKLISSLAEWVGATYIMMAAIFM